MQQPPRVRYTKEARRDFDRCRQFLRRYSPANVWRRTHEIVSAVRRIVENPEVTPVRKVDAVTGLHLRRCNVAQFVIVYVYFKPDALNPHGLVSLRAFRHASEEDALWEVRECESADSLIRERPFLSTRVCQL
jgi:plasmid stabilization system protein ParE